MPHINYLKYLRIKKGIKQKELALLINRAPSTVKAYEKTKLSVPNDIALKLQEIFGLDSIEPMQGYIKSVQVHTAEYKKLLPNWPVSRKSSVLWSLLGTPRRSISLKHCHERLTNKGL